MLALLRAGRPAPGRAPPRAIDCFLRLILFKAPRSGSPITAAVPVGVAFRDLKRVGTRDPTSFGAQWLAYTLPCGRFAVTRAGANARLGAEVVSLRLSRGGLTTYSLPVSRRTQIKSKLLHLTTRKRRFLPLDSASLHIVGIPTRQHRAGPHRTQGARARSV